MSFANNQGLGTLWRYPRFPLVRATLRYRAYGSAPRSSNVLREEPRHIRNTLNRSYLKPIRFDGREPSPFTYAMRPVLAKYRALRHAPETLKTFRCFSHSSQRSLAFSPPL